MIMRKSYQHLKSALVTLAVVCALVGATAPVQAAETPEHCIDIIGQPGSPLTVRGHLYTIYQGVTVGNHEQTYASLDSKLSGAITKLAARKYLDAEKKLSDFIYQVSYISDPNKTPKVKLGTDEASILLHGTDIGDDIGAEGARNCVRDLDK